MVGKNKFLLPLFRSLPQSRWLSEICFHAVAENKKLTFYFAMCTHAIFEFGNAVAMVSLQRVLYLPMLAPRRAPEYEPNP